MQNDLEATIRDLAARGELTHISISPNSKGTGWRASFAMSSKFGVSYAEDADPCKAIIVACDTAKIRSRRPIKVDGRLTETVDSIPQDIVEVDDSSDHGTKGGEGRIGTKGTTDEYLAGINAKTAASAEDVDSLM